MSLTSVYLPSYAICTQVCNVNILEITLIDCDVHGTFQKLTHLFHKFKVHCLQKRRIHVSLSRC